MALSDVILKHLAKRRNVGPLEGASHVGQSGEVGGGPYVVIELTIKDGVVLNAAYQSNGCPAAIGSASFLVELAIGRDVAFLEFIEPIDLERMLGGLPEGKGYCSEMVVNAFRKAIKGNTDEIW